MNRKKSLLILFFIVGMSTLFPNQVLAETVWSAGMETGNLSEWTKSTQHGSRGGSYDSGECIRPNNGVSTEQKHSGNYSMKMTIDSTKSGSGCRQFRHAESTSGGTFYYSAWLYFPTKYQVRSWSNIWQFKSEAPGYNDAVWVLEQHNRPNGNMYLVLRWKGIMAGPRQGEGTGVRYYEQNIKDFPANQWVHVEVYLRQSAEFDGQIIVWQDGTEVYNMNNVKTKYPGGDNRWSINTYGEGITPSDYTLYVDDAVVSTTKVGSGGGGSTAAPTPKAKPGDADNDGDVDGVDYVIWLNNYGQTSTQGSTKGDFNADRKVDGLDYIIWLNNYGR